MSIDSATLAVSRRYFDPYGNPIGAAPVSWPGTKGFVGGTADSATGLTNLGAREYSPGTGSFLTADPVLNPYDPQDLNPYAYASDNPVTSSDPTGMCPSFPDCNGVPEPGSHKPGKTDIPCGSPGGAACQTGSAPAPVYPVPPGDNTSPVFLAAPPPPPVERTPRILIPHQASTGLPACQSGVVSRFQSAACVPPPPPSGSSNPFAWFGQHWRGLAQIGVGAVAGIGAIACIASVICGAGVLGTLVGTTLIGAAAGAASYAVSGGRHTVRGYAFATGWGAVAGDVPSGGALVFGGEMLEYGGAAAVMTSGGAVNGLTYLFTTPQRQQTNTGGLRRSA